MPSQNFGTRKLFVIGMVVLVLAGVAGFFIIKGMTPTTANPKPSVKNLFPFSDSDNQGGLTTSQNPTASGINISESAQEPSSPFTTNSGDRLRRITNYPITGFAAFSQQKTVLEPKFNEKTQATELVSFLTTVNIVRFNSRQTGEIIDAEVARDTIIVSTRATSDIEKAQEIWFGSIGNPIIFRTWNPSKNTVVSFVGTLPKQASLAFCTPTFNRDLKKGAKGNDVKQLQQYLENKLSVRVTPDGSFGTKTVSLVKNVQKLLAVPPSGVVDATTRNALNADCAAMVAAASSGKPVALDGSFIAGNILRGTNSPDGAKLFLLKSTDAGVVGVIANSDGTAQKQVFSSPFTEWMPQWVSPTLIAMTTLASREADGYLYFLNPVTGEFRKVLGPLRGLTTLVSPDGKQVLYSNSTDQGFTTRLLSVATGQSKSIDLATLPAKCVWRDVSTLICGVPRTITPARYPDNWYQGLASFQDVVWSIDTARGSTSVVISPKDPLDVTQPAVSPDKSFLYFIDKTQGALWSYRLSE